MTMSKQHLKLKKRKIIEWFSICAALLPLLYLYKTPVPGISNFMGLGEFLLAILFTIVMIIENLRIKIKKDWFTILCLYSAFGSIFAIVYPWFNEKEYLAGVCRVIFYWLLFENAESLLNSDIFIKVYKKAAVVFSIYLIIQFIFYYALGIKLPSYISQNIMFEIPGDNEEYLRYFFRGRSVFNEPSYFTLYAAPYIAITGIKAEKITLREWIGLMIVTISLLLSTGVSGILLACISWLGIYLYQLRHKNKKMNPMFLIVAVVGAIGLFVFFTSSATAMTVNRLLTGSSASARIYRGVIVAQNMQFPEIISGVGLNQDSAFQEYYNIQTIYDESPYHTLQSSFVGIYVQLGLVGLIIFVLWGISLINSSKTYSSKIIALLLLVISIYEKNMFLYRMGFYLFIWLALNDASNSDHKYIKLLTENKHLGEKI